MSSKETKRTKGIELPLFIINIVLLYAFLITVSHLLAWVTIARHERSIQELKEILENRHGNHEQEPLTSEGLRGDNGDIEDTTVQQGSDILKVRFFYLVCSCYYRYE